MKLWYWYIAVKFNVYKGYSVEMLLRPNLDFERDEDNQKKRSGDFDKRKNGTRGISHKNALAIDKCVPGSIDWLYHPIWDLLKVPSLPIREIHDILANLRPEISSLIFEYYRGHEHPPYKINKPHDIEEILYQHSDLDAFMMCIGLMLDAKAFNRMTDYYNYARWTHTIFCRFITIHPFIFIAEDLFEYLKRYFYSETVTIDQEWFASLKDFDVGERKSHNCQALHIIDTYKMRRPNVASLPSCIYIVEQYFFSEDLTHLFKTIKNEKTHNFRNHELTTKVYWDIQRWETKLLMNKDNKAYHGQQRIRGHPITESLVKGE
jgi:hypothetical protein